MSDYGKDLIKAMNETTDSAGGYTVPTVLASKVYELIQNNAVTLADCEQVKMTSDNWAAPKVLTGTTTYVVAEGVDITDSDMTFGTVSLTPIKFAALMVVSTELLEDSNADVARIMVNQMAKDMALEIDNEILNGDGTNFSGYRDTTTYTSINTIAAGANGDALTLAKISAAITEGQTDNIDYDTLYVHPRVIKNLRDLADTTGRPIFDQATFGSPLLKEGVIGTIYGLKIKPTTQLPINLTKGSGTLLTDLVMIKSKQAGIFGNRRELRFAPREYLTVSDQYRMQATIRAAFTVNYQEAVCLIEDITA